MSAPVVDVIPRGFRAPGTAFMVAGSLIGAIGVFIFQLYAARVFPDPQTLDPFSALWTTFFILLTVLLVPLEQYVTREVARGRRSLPHDLRTMAAMVSICSVLGAGFVAATLSDVFDGNPQYIALIVLLCVVYGFLYVGKGILAGSRRFRDVGWVMIIESAVRLLAGVILVSLIRTPTSLVWAMVVGPLALFAMAWWRHDHGTLDVEATSPSKFLRGYVAGSAPAQLLLAGAPLAVLAFGGDSGLLSVLFFTFTLYRAPMTLIISLQGRLLPYLVGLSVGGEHQSLGRIVRRVGIGGSVLTVLGALAGWLIGPEVVALTYGEAYEPARTVAMLVAAGVVAATTAQVASQVLVAEGRTMRLGQSWGAGLLTAAVVAVLVGGASDLRVAIGFVCGEVVALAVMTFLAMRRPPAVA